MTYPVVAGSITGNSSGATNDTAITLPAGIVAGDLLLVVLNKDGGDPITSYTAGWTQLAPTASSTYNWTTVYWKIAAGGDTLTTTTTGFKSAQAWVAYRITGHDATTPLEAAAATYYTTTGPSWTAPNAPVLDPTGWGAEDTLWLAAYGWDNGATTLTAWPAIATDNRLQDRYNATTGCGAAAATFGATSASVDPGTATISSARDWVAMTIAVRPAVAGGSGVTGTVSSTNGGDSVAVTGTTSTPVLGSVALTDGADASTVVGASGMPSGVRLVIGIDHDRGAEAVSLAGLRWAVFSADMGSLAASGSGLSTDAGGVATIDLISSPYVVGDYVPVLIAYYNAATPAVDRTVLSMFGWVPAVAVP